LHLAPDTQTFEDELINRVLLKDSLIFSTMSANPSHFMNAIPSSRPAHERETDVDEQVQEPAKVILFNDSIHTFEEVISQIMKATRCDTTRAEALTWEVHNTGKAMVFEGPMNECLSVSAVLEEIALHTQIEV
jgi:ATP-dependent Clp protease adaptor protein ClpS